MNAVSHLSHLVSMLYSWVGMGGIAYRYEKITSMARTNLPRAVGMNGETKAGRKNTTDMVDCGSWH